jgi:hypothetical protein
VDEVPLKILTCHTEGCGNSGYAIPLQTDATDCFCGVCQQRITDVVTVETVADLVAMDIEPPAVREESLAVTDAAALDSQTVEETP